MAKRSKKRAVARTALAIGPILNDNKILLANIPNVDSPLSNEDITTVGNADKYSIDMTIPSAVNNSFTTIRMPATVLAPNPNVKFSPCSVTTHNANSHEPEQSFIADAAANYFNLTDNNEVGSDLLRILARPDEYCDDRPAGDISGNTLFEVTEGRPTVKVVTPAITDETITDNILLTYEDIRNKNLKNCVGLPSTTSIDLYNRELEVDSEPAYSELVINPKLSMFMYNPNTQSYDGLLDSRSLFAQYENTNSFYFKAGDRISLSREVNIYNAAQYNIVGILAVKPKPEYVDELKTVTIYIEVATKTTPTDSDWIVAESKVVPVREYGVFLSMSAYLCKKTTIRLRTNLDSTMGSINIFNVNADGGFTTHFSNVFYGFSGVISNLLPPNQGDSTEII